MAKILYVYRRNKGLKKNLHNIGKALDQMFGSVSCPNCSVNIQEDNNYLYIFNPEINTILREGFNLCVGSLTIPKNQWWEKERVSNAPLTILDRQNEICIYANALGSRTLWFYQDEEVFLASTSQRAMIVYLQSFAWNAQAATWMLATGCTGPGYAWDRRFKALGPGGTIHFHKRMWKLQHKNASIVFKCPAQTSEDWRKKLIDTLANSIAKTDVDLSDFVLTLSGGYDSRAALYYLRNKLEHTLSWGLEQSLQDKDTDAYIARKLAEQLQTQHHFFRTDQKNRDFDSVVDRFIEAGEGRVDHIQTHTDGLAMWSEIAAKGFRGIIRADEVFGWLPVQNELDTRLSVAFNNLNDFANLKSAESYGLEPQIMPEFYRRRESEVLEDWRDRLYQQYRVSYIQTGLHELVYPYVELLNPLLLDAIVELTHRLPTTWRTSKRLYAEIVSSLIPTIHFATKPSIPEVESIVRDPDVVQTIREEITATSAQHYLSPTLVNEIVYRMKKNSQVAHQIEANWRVSVKKYIPFSIKKMLRRSVMQYKLDNNQLAFRNYLILRVANQLEKDKQLLSKYV